MTFTNEERKALYKLLSDNPKLLDSSQAEDLAKTILMSNLDRLAEDIRKELERMEGERRRDIENAGRYYYKFLAPPTNDGKPKLVNSTKDIDYYEKPQRQPYKVRVKDLAAFCKEHGLKEKEMVKVGMGEIESHRGWERTPGYGGPMELGRPFQKPRPEAPKDKPAEGRKETRFIFQWALKPIDWTPDRDK